MLNNKKENLFLIPLIALVLIYSIYQTIKNDKDEHQLRLENNYVIGEITNHEIFGISESYYIYYKYNVNGIEYSKFVNNGFVYTDCERTRKCIGLKHVVYFDPNNPENAFMDFELTDLDIKKRNLIKEKMKARINNLKKE